jgi:hypothetical protein
MGKRHKDPEESSSYTVEEIIELAAADSSGELPSASGTGSTSATNKPEFVPTPTVNDIGPPQTTAPGSKPVKKKRIQTGLQPIRRGSPSARTGPKAQAVLLRIPTGLIRRINKALKALPVKPTRLHWILLAIQEKVERDLRD